MSKAVFVGLSLGLAFWSLRPMAMAAEQTWEIRGDVLAVGDNGPRLVDLRLPDGSTVSIPLTAFSVGSRAGIVSGVEGVMPAVRAAEASSPLAAIEESVAVCRSADEALRALKLGLAGGVAGVPPAEAEAALARWAGRAQRGEVRFGREWVGPAVAAAAAKASDALITEVTTMVRLGNVRLVKDYLEKASRVNPSSGRADFLLGLAVAFGVGQRVDSDKALKLFAEVVAREPDNGAALNNLAVCEVLSRRFDDALSHFTLATECLEDPQVIASNVGRIVAGASDKRVRLSAKQIEAFASLYRRLTPDPSVPPPLPPQPGWTFLSPLGQPVTASPQSSFADLCSPPVAALAERRGVGIVVAPKVVLVPAMIPFPSGAVLVRTKDATAVDHSAQVIATSQRLGITLLRCESLAMEPVQLAANVPGASAEVIAVQPAARARRFAGQSDTPGAVVAIDVLPDVFVYTGTIAGAVAGGPIVDASGRIVGFVASTPRVPLPGTPRAFGTPIDHIWPFLKDHLPDLEPSKSRDSAASWDAVRADVARRIVDVVAKPAP